ncbi:MAG: peptidyl-prolyl cis-trans isomerase [Nitrospinota bacterium]
MGLKVLVAACLLWGIAFGPGPGLAQEPPDGQVAARVNGVTISVQSVDRVETVLRGLQNGGAALPEQNQQPLRRRALESLIAEELLYQEAVAQGIKVAKKDVYQVLRQLKETIPGKEFSRLLGIHWAVKGDIVKTIERNLLIQRLLEEAVLRQAQVSAEELQHYYQNNQALFRTGPEVRLQQLLLFVGPGEQETLVRAKAEEFVSRASAEGKDFGALARAFSQGPGRGRGGDLGWRSVDYLPQGLKVAVRGASEGAIIGPIQIPRGFVIAKVVAKRPSRVLPLDEMRDHLLTHLREEKLKERHEAFLAKLKARATIEVLLP